MKLVLALLSLICLALPAAAQSNSRNDALVIDVTRPGTVFLKVKHVDPENAANVCDTGGDISGSGFVISSSGFVVSAKHVFDTPADCPQHTKVVVEARIGTSASGEWLDAALLKRGTSSDTALLLLPTDHSYQPISVCNPGIPSAGRHFMVLGFPLGLNLQSYDYIFSQISGLDGQIQWFGSGDVDPGVSGGPVIDLRTGQAIGLLRGAIPGSSVRAVVPITEIHSEGFLKSAGFELKDCPTVQAEGSDCDGWMTEADYRACYTRKVNEGFFPAAVSAVLSPDEVQLTSAYWKKMPTSASFCFVSCSDMTEGRYNDLNGSLQNSGFGELFHNRMEDGTHGGRHQATWIARSAPNCATIVEKHSCIADNAMLSPRVVTPDGALSPQLAPSP